MVIEVVQFQEGVSSATLTAYLQDAPFDNQISSNRPAIIICPGGAYLGYTEKEAEPVALKFVSEGYQAFVLKYSIGDIARFPAPFIDAARAIMMVRRNGKRWGIDTDKICLCGFSTGGHVAAIFSATWQDDYLGKALNAENELFKPNALLLGYPLLDMHQFVANNQDKSQEMKTLLEMMLSSIYGTATPMKSTMEEWDVKNKITTMYPPTFLWTTAEDSFVGVNDSMNLIKELSACKIPYEFHIFEKGSHGLSLGNQTIGYSEDDVKRHGNTHRWVELAINWLGTKL